MDFITSRWPVQWKRSLSPKAIPLLDDHFKIPVQNDRLKYYAKV